MTKCPSCNGERSWWLLSNDKCLQSATARTLWKKGDSSAPSVFHAFLCAICERALNLYVCRGGALWAWLAYHRTQTQSATQWECLFNPSTDIDSYYSYDTRTRQKCFIRTGYSFQPSIRLNSNNYCICDIKLVFILVQCFCLLVVTLFLNIVFGLHLYSFCCPALVLLLLVIISPSLFPSLHPLPYINSLLPFQYPKNKIWSLSNLSWHKKMFRDVLPQRERERVTCGLTCFRGPPSPQHPFTLFPCPAWLPALILRGKRAETPLGFCAQPLVRQLLQVHWLLPLLSASTRHLLHLGVSQSFPF